MIAVTIDQRKAQLELRLQTLRRQAAEIEELLCAEQENDSDDNSIDSEDDEVLARLSRKAYEDIARARKALTRCVLGSATSCARCGETIPAERLEIVPDTSYCVRCA